MLDATSLSNEILENKASIEDEIDSLFSKMGLDRRKITGKIIPVVNKVDLVEGGLSTRGPGVGCVSCLTEEGLAEVHRFAYQKNESHIFLGMFCRPSPS